MWAGASVGMLRGCYGLVEQESYSFVKMIILCLSTKPFHKRVIANNNRSGS